MSGFTSPNALSISSRSVSDRTYRFSLSTRSRVGAHFELLFGFLAGNIQNLRVFPRYAQICSNSVDLPMPGAPPTKHKRPLHPAAAQHAVELAESR